MTRRNVRSTATEPVATRLSGTAVERPRNEPPHGVPVALRSAQHIRVSRGRFGPPWSKQLVLVKWVISGAAEIGIGGRRVRFGPGEVAVYLPTIPHQFWAVDDVNEMCWFSLDGRMSQSFALGLDLHPGVYPYGPAPVEKITGLMESLRDHTVQGRRRASLAAIELLYDLANSIRAPQVPSVIRDVQHVIQQEFSDPELSASSLAERFHYHRGSLSRLFHQTTGVTMIDYLTEVRLQEAIALLKHTDDKVSAVGRRCGFRDVAYFCRWLRKHTGTAAGELRRSTDL